MPKSMAMRAGIIRAAPLACLCGLLSTSACGGDEKTPMMPSVASSVAFTQLAPASGSTIIVAEGTPPGAFIARNSGGLALGLSVTSSAELPWARLNVYLLSGDTYCGQNLPDSPTWTPFRAGLTTSYTVTGFQVYRLPCDVTGIRAMLHTRNSGLLTPPTTSETVAEATSPASYQLR